MMQEEVDIENKIIYIKGVLKNNIEKVYETNKNFFVLYKDSKQAYQYKKSDMAIRERIEPGVDMKEKMDYFKKIASYKDLENSKGQDDIYCFYKQQIEKLENMNSDSALFAYLNKTNKDLEGLLEPIFPFGLNYSQMKAIDMSFSHQISVIQGPPGTGKTQTILNIIANVVKMKKSIAVVSPNNKATNNIYEKLEKEGFGFIAAKLGNSGNRKNFYQNITKVPMGLDSWLLKEAQLRKLELDLSEKKKMVVSLLKEKNNIAILEQDLREWELEKEYFVNYQKDSGTPNNREFKMKKFSSVEFNLEKKKAFIIDLRLHNPKIPNIFYKFKYFFKYGIYYISSLKTRKDWLELIDKKIVEYYSSKIAEIKREIKKRSAFLIENQYEKLLKEIETDSKYIFRHNLFVRYQNINNRNFEYNSHKTNFKNFSASFPVVLSTCDSIMECISDEAIFDYVVVDESSMASLMPGIFSLAKARNIIIVGDDKQLPPIPIDEKKIIENLVISSEFDYFKKNLLTSLKEIYGENLPNTLLKEHYRCHPMIINFCNKQYYDNQLIIMTEDKRMEKPLVKIRTSKGNHMKFDQDSKIFNQREIDTFLDEEFTKRVPEIVGIESLGFISPYCRQVEVAGRKVPFQYEKAIIDTVHKFQGRECDAILFSTVLDTRGGKQINFVDNACLLNVAVSRAKRMLILNTSEEIFMQNNKDIAALIRYINYYGEHSIIYESKVRSIFDLLQKEFSTELEERLSKINKKHSKYDSENLTKLLIDEILREEEFKHLDCQPEYEVRLLVMNYSELCLNAQKYIENGARLDFIIYNKMDRKPVAAIEVDGHRYHKYDNQKLKDGLKKSIIKSLGINFISLSTNGSREAEEIRNILRNENKQQEGEKVNGI
ncbi:AAA family ATPase [Listeria seeligeri]|nr:AAA family ATPase [Listeria seeligeri]MBF2437025.1 AAA family ATPase [Listeria seeligeri]